MNRFTRRALLKGAGALSIAALSPSARARRPALVMNDASRLSPTRLRRTGSWGRTRKPSSSRVCATN